MLSMSEANKYVEGGNIIKQIIRILYYCRKRHKRRVFHVEAAVILPVPLPHLQPQPSAIPMYPSVCPQQNLTTLSIYDRRRSHVTTSL